MTKPTTDKLQLELKENKEKVQQLTNMVNSLQIRNIQIEAVLADRLTDFSEENKEQVKHPSLFVSGARPAIMWICALGLFMSFFIMPLAEWMTAIWYPEVSLPDLNTGELMTLTLSLLGLGGLRSFEKSKGVARDNLRK